MLTCPYSNRCWRYSYSRYLQDHPYDVPPDRMVLFCAQYATAEMMPKKGLFAEYMPLLRNGERINMCPVLYDLAFTHCYEYTKESKRLAQRQPKDQQRLMKTDTRPRVWIPQEVRHAVAQRDHYRCVYCNRAQNQYWNGKIIRCVVDHFIPLAKGGHELDPKNLVFSCRDCNQAKGAEIWQLGCRVGYYQEM